MTLDSKDQILKGNRWFQSVIDHGRSGVLYGWTAGHQRRLQQLRANQKFYAHQDPSLLTTFAKFFGMWIYINYLCFLGLFNRSKIRKFSIWDADFEKHLNLNEVQEFFKSSAIFSDSQETSIFAKGQFIQNLDKKHYFFDRPLIEAIRHLPLNLFDIIQINVRILENFYSFTVLFNQYSEFLFGWKDFVTEALFHFYKEKGLQSIYRSNSDFNSQEFWMDDSHLNTVWYSINSINFQYLNVNEPILDHPMYYFMQTGTNWTWNNLHANWLRTILGAKRVHVIGPLMFYQASAHVYEPLQPKRLIIFDVTPFKEEIIRSRVFRESYNYYELANCSKFISDVVSVFSSLGYSIFLKPKRPFIEDHATEYRNLVQDYVNRGLLAVLPAESNMFDEIMQSDLVVTIPLSSPYHVAKFLNKEAVYYDPTANIDYVKMGYGPSDFLNSPSQLKARFGQSS